MEFTKKEAAWIIVSIIIFAFIILFPNKYNNLSLLFIPIFIILTNILSKKIASPFYHIKIEHTCWELQRFGYYRRSYFKKPIPMGLIFPFFLTFFSLGIIKTLTFLQYNAKNLRHKRILKQSGRMRKSEINESDLAFTSFWGFFSLIILSIIGIIIKFTLNNEFGTELAKFSIFYGIWNMIPFSELDGSKLFFGSLVTWILTGILYIIFLIVVLLL